MFVDRARDFLRVGGDNHLRVILPAQIGQRPDEAGLPPRVQMNLWFVNQQQATPADATLYLRQDQQDLFLAGTQFVQAEPLTILAPDLHAKVRPTHTSDSLTRQEAVHNLQELVKGRICFLSILRRFQLRKVLPGIKSDDETLQRTLPLLAVRKAPRPLVPVAFGDDLPFLFSHQLAPFRREIQRGGPLPFHPIPLDRPGQGYEIPRLIVVNVAPIVGLIAGDRYFVGHLDSR